MSFPFTAAAIAKCTNSKPENVAKYWQLIVAEAKKQGLVDIPSLVGIAATIGIECHFKPVHEIGTPDYFKKYDNRKDLGNIHPGDGFKYRGRGFIQLTGFANYAKYGKLINVDLVNNPDRALEPEIAVALLVAYFKDHGCNVWAARGHWRKVRRLVNGGDTHLADFLGYVWALLDEAYRK